MTTNLFTDRKRAVDIFQGMVDRDLVMPWVAIAVAEFKLDAELITLMAQSGCSFIDIAIESGTKRVLKEVIGKPVNHDHAKEMAKFARKQGIFVAANFVIGFPTERPGDEIRQTLSFAEEINVDYVKIFVAIPLRHTKLWDLCLKTGSLKQDFQQKSIRWSTGQIETDQFKSEDLTILRAYEWDRINYSSEEKRLKTSEMMGITENELLDIRLKTLQNAIATVQTR